MASAFLKETVTKDLVGVLIMKKILILGFLSFFGTTSSLLAAPLLQLDSNNQLIGVQGIYVESGSFRATYDVSFQDGTCIDLFTGCNSNSEDLFAINTRLGAANAELLIAMGSFSDSPNLINGCESLVDCFITAPSNINASGPSGGSVSGGTLWIQAGPGNDFPLSESLAANRFEDFTSVTNRTYAIWTPSAISSVPVPAAVWLFGSGLIGLIGLAGRKN